VIGNATPLPTGATRLATMPAATWWATLAAGSQVLISPGSYSGVLTIQSVGSAAQPIVVTAFDPANPPTLGNSVDFQNAAYVRLSHVVVQSPTYQGVLIRMASHDITVADSTINAAPTGISITDGAGTGHQVLRNTINDAQTDGIYADVNSDASNRTLISGNQVARSGQHGIELRASHYQVEHNVVASSGAAGTGGVSGIHVYRGTPSEDSGADNLVRYNAAYATRDPVAADGNGIEIDQWCDGNVVAYNLVWNNDGAGIIVYDGNNNAVQGNTAYSDGVDPGHTHSAALGELIIGASSSGSAAGNHAWNNLLASTRSTVPGLYVDTRALGSVNTVGANLYYNGSAGSIVRWGDATLLSTTAQIDASTGVSGSVVAAPSFANPAQPLASGLRLTAAPARPGVLPTGDVDYAGTAAQAGWSFLGAYFTSP
jgi:parallel beta-helix repeat protein